MGCSEGNREETRGCINLLGSLRKPVKRSGHLVSMISSMADVLMIVPG